MSEERQKDPAYPYSARRGKTTDAAPPDRATSRSFGHRLWRWLARAAIIAAVLLLLATIGGGIIFYRAARQAWLIADLERWDCSVRYWHQGTDNQGPLSEFLQDRLDERWWGDVREVSQAGDSYLDSLFSVRELTDSDISAICAACGRFRNLEAFRISTNLFTCDKIARWPHLTRIERLDLESTQLGDADLAVIGRAKRLKQLRLASASITSEGIRHLARLPNLESVTFDNVQLKPTGANDIRGFQALKSLVVGRSPEFGDDAIACLGPLPNIEDVNFNRAPIGDKGLARLLASGKVRSLIVGEGELTDSSLATLINYPAPRWLVLSRMKLTDDGLKPLAGKEFPTLILDHTEITDDAFRTLAQIQELDFLSLSDTKVTGVSMGQLLGSPSLRYFDLSGTALTASAFSELAQTKCTDLVLSRTGIGDCELLLFVNNDHLTQIDVTETQVTADGIRKFYKARAARPPVAGREGTITLTTDFPKVVESILGPQY